MEKEKAVKLQWPVGPALAEISKLSRTLFLIWMALYALPGWKRLTMSAHLPMSSIYAPIFTLGVCSGAIWFSIVISCRADDLPAFSIRNLPRIILTILLQLIEYCVEASIAAFLLGFFVYAHHYKLLFYVWVALAVVFIVTHVVGKHLATKPIFVGSVTVKVEPCKSDDEL